jgi:purine-nucleoside phosphorylase
MHDPFDSMPAYVQAVEKAAELVVTLLGDAPATAVLVGSGLGSMVDRFHVHHRLDNADIPGASVPGVPSHKGQLTSVSADGHPAWILDGRVHLYEGASPRQVVFLVRVLARAGVKRLFITNAAGGINLSYGLGDLMLISDHINFMGVNPLEGPNHDAWGPRFPDMSDPYASRLRDQLTQTAEREGLVLRSGVYVGIKGPNLETRAEYRMLRQLGADVVGMSTVPETLAAVHMGMEVAGVSVVTDMCDPDDLKPVSIDQILSAAAAAEPSLARLVRAFILGES